MNRYDDIITSTELESILEVTPSQESLFMKSKLLLQAINDWPTTVTEPKELLSILSKEIGEPLTLVSISHYETTLRFEDSAWKIEAISSILDLFQNDTQKTLYEIVNDITDEGRTV